MKVIVNNRITNTVVTYENVSDVEIGYDTVTVWTEEGYKKFNSNEVLVTVKEG
jgi:hypothetical protein